MGKDLRQFLQVVKDAGSEFYVEIRKPLKPIYEPHVIQHKLAKQGRFPVIYCPEIEGSKLPLVTNLFSSYEMLGLALGIPLGKLRDVGKAEVFQEYRKRLNDLKPTREVPVKEAPVREVVLKGKDVDLGLLPITKHAELDAGKYITIGTTIIKDPVTGAINTGVYRQQLKGKDKIACQMSPRHHGRHIAQRYAELNKPIEVVTVIGHHPAFVVGAAAGAPLVENELEIAGGLLGEPLEVIPGVTVDLPVPARAEIAIEGIIDPTEMPTDGPFGEYYGCVGAERPSYIIQVKAITMRRDAIYNDLYPAHQEHSMVNVMDRESHIYDKTKPMVPNLIAVRLGPEGQCAQVLLYMSIKKRSQGDGRLAALVALCADPSTKVVVVVDEDVDVYDEAEVLWAIAARVRADLDVTVIPRMPASGLNPVAYDETGMSHGPMDAKLIIDATQSMVLPSGKRSTLPMELLASMKLEDYLK